MRKLIFLTGLIGLLTLPLIATEDVFKFGRFGTVHVYAQSEHPATLVLFISGDGGWNLGVIDMARALVEQDARVVGIDITHYLAELNRSSEKCVYPAADFEILSKFIQKKYNYPEYRVPILVGYSSGATLVYALLVQAPVNTFRAGVSLGFCPDLPVSKPLCRGDGLEGQKLPGKGGYLFQPAKSLQVPWMVLQGEIDQVCPAGQTSKFVEQVPNGRLISLPKVGHGFSVQRNWLPQFKEIFSRWSAPGKTLEFPRREELKDLPLEEVPAVTTTDNYLALLLSGDGGWATPDRAISAELARAGIPVVGLNSLFYFWKKRSPEETATDVAKVIRYYSNLWEKKRFILIGYSLGADVLPFVINRLPDELRSRIALVTLIGLSSTVEFEFHLSNWLGGASGSNEIPVLPEFLKLKGMPILCIYGDQDDDALCKDARPDFVKVIRLPGGHRIGDNFEPIVKSILTAAAVK